MRVSETFDWKTCDCWQLFDFDDCLQFIKLWFTESAAGGLWTIWIGERGIWLRDEWELSGENDWDWLLDELEFFEFEPSKVVKFFFKSGPTWDIETEDEGESWEIIELGDNGPGGMLDEFSELMGELCEWFIFR